MNIKILDTVEKLLQTSPQALRDKNKLKQLIQGTFDVEINNVEYNNIGELVDRIDDAVLDKYFRNHWQPEIKKYKHSGLKLIDEINQLKPRAVLDIGCGYNEFRGKINNLTGIDPYNSNADQCVKIMDYQTDQKFDAVMALGSINFGSTDKVFSELEKAVELGAPGCLYFFRVNPGLSHNNDESRWISFYPWTSNFIVNCADYFGLDVLDLRNDYKNRIYFVWRKKS